MRLIPVENMEDGSVLFYQWKCDDCRCKSFPFGMESESLAWASQPIPFLPNILIDDDGMHTLEESHNDLINDITSTLAVREVKQ